MPLKNPHGGPSPLKLLRALNVVDGGGTTPEDTLAEANEQGGVDQFLRNIRDDEKRRGATPPEIADKVAYFRRFFEDMENEDPDDISDLLAARKRFAAGEGVDPDALFKAVESDGGIEAYCASEKAHMLASGESDRVIAARLALCVVYVQQAGVEQRLRKEEQNRKIKKILQSGPSMEI